MAARPGHQRAQQLRLAGAGGAADEAVGAVEHEVDGEHAVLGHADGRRRRRLATRRPSTGRRWRRPCTPPARAAASSRIDVGRPAPTTSSSGSSKRARSRAQRRATSSAMPATINAIDHLALLRQPDPALAVRAVELDDDRAHGREPVGRGGDHDPGHEAGVAAQQAAGRRPSALGERLVVDDHQQRRPDRGALGEEALAPVLRGAGLEAGLDEAGRELGIAREHARWRRSLSRVWGSHLAQSHAGARVRGRQHHRREVGGTVVDGGLAHQRAGDAPGRRRGRRRCRRRRRRPARRPPARSASTATSRTAVAQLIGRGVALGQVGDRRCPRHVADPERGGGGSRRGPGAAPTASCSAGSPAGRPRPGRGAGTAGARAPLTPTAARSAGSAGEVGAEPLGLAAVGLLAAAATVDGVGDRHDRRESGEEEHLRRSEYRVHDAGEQHGRDDPDDRQRACARRSTGEGRAAGPRRAAGAAPVGAGG